MENIVLLGSSGSIGINCLNVVSNNLDKFNILGLAVRTSTEKLKEQIKIFSPQYVVVWDKQKAKELKNDIPSKIKILVGMEGLIELVSLPQTDVVVNALVGSVGLLPTVNALEQGKKVALANKETMVIGGDIINDLLDKGKGSLTPIDSEHSAIHQCLDKTPDNQIEKLIITASGGPFLNKDKSEFSTITPKQALAHPNWEMGNKISIDSATLMNKGLEVIEAHYLFRKSYDDIDVVVHPQSIIHSMVQFIDGSILAQLGTADMRTPIQYALSYPNRLKLLTQRLNFAQIGSLTFKSPDTDRFPCLKLAYNAGKTGGSITTVMNAANEVAVDLFLNNKIGFNDIPIIVEKSMETHAVIKKPTIEEIISIDTETREKIIKE